MSRLYRRGDRYYLDWFEHGRRWRRSLGRLDRDQAQALQAEKDAELAGVIPRRSGRTCANVLDEYLTWYSVARPTTIRRARSTLRPFVEAFGGELAESVSPARVEAWELARPARAAAHNALKLAKAAYRRAVRLGQLRSNPLDRVRGAVSVTSRAPSYYRPADLPALYAQPHGALWRLMVNTGVRRGEIFKARREDVRDGALYVESTAEGRTKSGKWRAIPLNAEALAALNALPRKRLVRCGTPDTLSHWFRRESHTAGLGGTLHWLRHTFCTALVQSGVSLHDVQMLAGHSTIQVTERYAHHAPGRGRAAVDALDAWSHGSKMAHSSVSRGPQRRPAGRAASASRPRSSAG